MSIEISPNLPANVVEIGNEVTQSKINEINSGTLATQTWVATSYAPKASPTFTGTVTIPAGASINGYLTTSAASSTYLTISSAGSTYLSKSGGTMTGTLVLSQASGVFNTDFVVKAYNDGYGSGSGAEYLHTFTNSDGRFILATNGGGLTFPDATTQTTAGYPNSNPNGYIADAPSDGTIYGRQNGAWVAL